MPKEDYLGRYEEVQRTENGKVFRLNGTQKAYCAQIGHWHYRDDPKDLVEPWKDINDQYDAAGKFAAMPYMTAQFDGTGIPKLVITHRATGKIVSLGLAKLDGGQLADANWTDKEGKGRAWLGGKFGFEGMPAGGLKLWAVIPNKQAPHSVKLRIETDAEFKWIGDAYSEENGGVVLFDAGPIRFTPFWARDFNGVLQPMIATYDAGVMTLTVLPLPGAVYPILVDPTAIPQEQVGASADDVTHRVYSWGPTHTWSATATNLPVGAGWDGSYSYSYDVSFRFTTVPIPANATVNSATFQVKADNNRSSTTVNTNIYCEDADNPGATTSDADFHARVRTDTLVAWDSIGSWVAGTWYTSPDIAGPVGEVIARGGWVSNNALAIFWQNDGSTIAAGVIRDGRSWDYSGNVSGPKFDCTYTEAGAGGVTNWAWMGQGAYAGGSP